jgi:GNAT superfamily N-acetyltransferase
MIRPARPGDVGAIHRLVGDLAEYQGFPDSVVSTPDDLRRSLFGGQPAVFAHVAEHEGVVVGYAMWFLTYSTWTGMHGIHLEDVYVVPSVRGQGYGRALLAELARICLDRGYRRLEWWVLRSNAPALRFYASLGAVTLDELRVHRLAGPALEAMARHSPPG